MKKGRNYYLIGLPIFGIALVAGLITMIGVAIKNPVEMDSSHMMPYHELDKNYNQIAEAEKKFDSKYNIAFSKLVAQKDKPAKLELNITEKNGNPADVKITALVTRPDTSKYDIKITNFHKVESTYLSQPFSLGLEGRWKVVYKIEAGDMQKFLDFETFVKKQ